MAWILRRSCGCRRNSRVSDGDDDLGLKSTGKEVSEVRKRLHDLVKTQKGRRKPYLCRRRRLTAVVEGVHRNCPCRRPGAKEIVWLGLGSPKGQEMGK